ncbi:hypothetical protein TSAR_001644 [Trichomalopsis sarcophagae]|uniref:Uncharacterized protein n=1 Tax=Trichomalopsis sarcophagae TaxID=543379 RepID=A0A232EI93_9HYME|nr:hypothetical protein TSAR_001644 [Trichomalopsis sarcophagae]
MRSTATVAMGFGGVFFSTKGAFPRGSSNGTLRISLKMTLGLRLLDRMRGLNNNNFESPSLFPIVCIHLSLTPPQKYSPFSTKSTSTPNWAFSSCSGTLTKTRLPYIFKFSTLGLIPKNISYEGRYKNCSSSGIPVLSMIQMNSCPVARLMSHLWVDLVLCLGHDLCSFNLCCSLFDDLVDLDWIEHLVLGCSAALSGKALIKYLIFSVASSLPPASLNSFTVFSNSAKKSLGVRWRRRVIEDQRCPGSLGAVSHRFVGDNFPAGSFLFRGEMQALLRCTACAACLAAILRLMICSCVLGIAAARVGAAR